MKDIIRRYAKPDPQIVEGFRALSTATVYEAAGQLGKMDPQIKPTYSGAQLCGPAVTVKCHVGDNLMLHKAVTVAGPGDILVVTIDNHLGAGAWGEILLTAAKARGIAGLVIDGAVRDTGSYLKHDFPVFARGIAIGATTKKHGGTINHPIVCGNVLVNPGDIVLGDADGVVVVPKARAQAVLESSLERERKEAALMQQLRAGATTLELLGLNEALQSLGLTEEEE